MPAVAAVLLLSCLASGQTEQAPALPDPLSGVISQRAAEADKTRADLQAQLDAAAKVAADLAKQPPANLPTVKPQGNATYVDLSAPPSSGGISTQALPQALNFEAVGRWAKGVLRWCLSMALVTAGWCKAMQQPSALPTK